MFPTISFSNIFASSSADVASGMTYFLPVIYVAFAVAAVVAVTRLIIAMAHWIGDKISSLHERTGRHQYGHGGYTESQYNFDELREIYNHRKNS